MIKLISLAAVLFVNTSLLASSEVLPKGVSTLIYRNMQIQTSSFYGAGGREIGHGGSGRLDLQGLAEYMPGMQEAKAQLDAIDPELAKGIDLISWNIDAKVNAQVDVMAYAFGLSDTWTLGLIVPFVEAKTQLIGGFTEYKSIQKLKERINKIQAQGKSSNELEAIRQIIGKLQNLEAQHIQGYLVNDLGYQPLGDWNGQGLSDVSVFAKNLVYSSPKYSLSLEYGTDLPTAYVDDPNVLTDFSFGHGTWAPYGVLYQDYFASPSLRLFHLLKVQYFFPQTESLRYGDPTDVIAEDVGDFRVQRGNAYTSELGASGKISSRWSLSQSAIYQYNEESSADSRVLSWEQDRFSLWKSLSVLSYSSVEAYLRKETWLPFRINLAYENVFAGKNANQLETYYLEARLFF